ncbi:MAG: S-layer homology domain-containing protein [Defluviitaleaceae bacterium]|nr:S-layer homology domain-containing protein [Defluviitaleaceae bacterium]
MIFNKRNSIVAFALIVLMTIGSILPVMAVNPAQRFNDVPPNHFAFEAINWVSDPNNGIGAFMIGNAAGNFNPNNTLNKFEAAQIFAMAAGFRHLTELLPPDEQAVFARAEAQNMPFLENMASQFSSGWISGANREIAFLMYRGILTQTDVQNFVTRVGQAEQRPLLTRQEAIAWTVRLIGDSSQAQLLTLPQPNPFADDAQINIAFRRYVYHARNEGIIQGGGGNFDPAGHFTRAQMATVFFNALANRQTTTQQGTNQGGGVVTINGTITAMHHDTQVTITSAGGTETFSFASNAVIMVDNVQRTASFLQSGMTATVLVNAQRQILSIRASHADTPATTPTQPTTPSATLQVDEGFVENITLTPQTITIRTQRVNIIGQVINESRIFSVAPNATITRGGEATYLRYVQVNDIVFFGFSGGVIYEMELMERERTIRGELIEARPADTVGGNPTLTVQVESGTTYELRATSGTTFTRGHVHNLSWSDLRIGDNIVAYVEFDRLLSVAATGIRSNTSGRLTEIRITERNAEITILNPDGNLVTLIVMPGIFDIYTLRIGMQLEIALDSREVIEITIMGSTQGQNPVVLGFIQSIRADGSIVVVSGQGTSQTTHTIQTNTSTTMTRGGTTLVFADLRVNMNVHVVMTAPQSNVAQSITVLP